MTRRFAHMVPPVAELQALTTGAVFTKMPTGKIQIQPGFNPRGQLDAQAFTEDALSGLQASIEAEGLLTPLWVRDGPGGAVHLIAGERRLRAAQAAGLPDVPVRHFGPLDDRRARQLALLENAQRTNPSLIEQTLAGFALMRDLTGLDQAALLRHLHALRKGREDDTHGLGDWLSRTYGTGVSVWSLQRAKILNFTPDELQAVQRGQLDLKAAYELARAATPDARAQLLADAVAGRWTAAQVRAALTPTRPDTLQVAARTLQRQLRRAPQLTGQDAERAEALMAELTCLLKG